MMNASWTVLQLYEELKKEHESITQMQLQNKKEKE